jgi:Ca2+-binding EF-hand superfamily protein
MQPRSLRLATLLVAAGLALPALAQMPAPRGPDPFSAYDQNGDGSISPAEFDAHRQQRMQSRAEDGRMMRNAGSGPMFSELDTDGDGKLSPDELAAGQRGRMMNRPGMGPGAAGMPGPGMGRNRPAFADFDTNGDGHIGRDELEAARAARISERAQAGYPMRGLQDMPGFEAMDSDGDGQLSPEEFARHQAAQPMGKGR